MQKNLGDSSKIIGLVLVVIGIGFAVQVGGLSGSIGLQVTQAVIGADTNKVMMYYIFGLSTLLLACIFSLKIKKDLK